MAVESIGRIFLGDNLPILKKIETGSINLIYIDPPFNTGKKQSSTQIKTTKSANGNRKGFKGNNYETITLGTKEYEDNYGENFIEEFLKPRLVEAYRILAPNGSLYLHIDYREVHYCKILLDKIFGRESFINEIIWAYDFGGKSKSRWPAKHDNILYYVKDPNNYIFNSSAVDREEYMAPGLVGPEKAALGKLPTDTWWHTIVGTNSKERTGYPTQKPLRLINRIIQASSLPNQTVLDFFAGSGTIGVSCLQLGRKFILIDINPVALEVMAGRFPNDQEIEWVGFDPRLFQSNQTTITPINNDKQKEDFETLASFAKSIRNDIEELSEFWEESQLSWVIQLAAAKKGKLGRKLIASWLAAMGVTIDHTKDNKAGFIYKGFRIATKFSTLWSEGSYKFQQIRKEGYDYLICLGISPHGAHCWVFTREFIIDKTKPQHKGADYMLTINPDTTPNWAKVGGGSLDGVYKILLNIEENNARS